MTPEAFENSLVEKITAAGLTALPYPESPAKYYPENSPGEVLVRYEGRKVIQRDIEGQYNRVKLFAEIVVVSRKLREADGAYSWLQQLFADLEGHTMEGASAPLHMEVESFMDENEGTWQFGQKWSCETLEFIAVEAEDAIYYNDGIPYKLPLTLK